MQCPYCQHTDSRVLESRSTEEGQSIRRRRECLRCKGRFTTYERIETVSIKVIKQSGKRELFEREKLLRGITRACDKTGVPLERLEAIVGEIEAQLQQRPEREVASQEIGQLVLRYLRQENEVAYVRFASVYGKFKGIRDFVDTLDRLQSTTESSQESPDWSKSTAEEPELKNPSSIVTSP
jgi:transcriptional repressor NrdR